MKILVKTSMKLLFRTKAFWFFLLLTPFLSTLILKTKFDSSAAYISGFTEEVNELAGADEKVAYFGGKGEYVVKVYDASMNVLSDHILDKLAKSGLFFVCRADISGEDTDIAEYINSRLEKDGFEDRMGAAILIDRDFEEKALGGNAGEALTFYILSEDKRSEALEREITFQLSKLTGFVSDAKMRNRNVSAQDIVDQMNIADEILPKKEVVTVAGSNGRNLSKEQINVKTQIGYAFAFMTLGFVFCGIFVAHTSIREQKNGVYTRISLTGTSTLKYFISKFIIVFFISLIMTGVVALYSIILSEKDLGMSRLSYLAMIFMMGLIFGSISMLIGILMGDVMSANVAAFTIWCMSALLSGLYFPLDYSSVMLKALSFMMPQKWFLEGTEMLFAVDNRVFPMLICITAAYLAVILSLGSLGLKIRRTDSWGNS